MNKLPLCVDLDHSLINTDLTFEAILEALKLNPLNIFIVLKFILLMEKKELKCWLSQNVSLEWDRIPKNVEVEAFIRKEIENGRMVYIVSGSHQKFLENVHRLFPMAKEAIGTSDKVNLIGKNKAEYLINRFGAQQFDYLGDSRHDLHIWKHAKTAYIVSRNQKLIRQVKNREQVFKTSRNSLKHIIKGIRVNQWSKNALIFLPAILSHQFSNLNLWIELFLGALFFSFAASAVYVINDLVDVPNDRVHRTKQFRPIASGNLDIYLSLKLICLLIVISLVGSFFLNFKFFIIVAVYFITNLFYSLKLKKLPVIDVFLLSAFYLIRIAGGSEIGNIPLSPWLKTFSLFFFLSLGFLKRYTEVLLNFTKSGITSSHGRAYVYQDSQVLFGFGILAAYISVLVLSLYIYQGQSGMLYKSIDYMWGIVVLLAYWKTSLWFKASHAKVKDDPVKHVLGDRESQVVMFLVCLLYSAATFF